MGLPNIGPLELIIILAIALLIVGPGKLPELGSAFGRTIREFRKASSDITDSAKAEPAAPAPVAPAPQAAVPMPAPNTLTSPAPAPNTLQASVPDAAADQPATTVDPADRPA